MNLPENPQSNLEHILLREQALHEAIKELLESQRMAILERQQRHLMEVSSLLNARVAEAVILKKQREIATQALAAVYAMPKTSRLTELLGLLDFKIAAPLKVLTDALNQQLAKSRRCVRMNKYLAGRLIAVTRDLIGQMAPGQIVRTYTQKGGLKVATETPRGGMDFLA